MLTCSKGDLAHKVSSTTTDLSMEVRQYGNQNECILDNMEYYDSCKAQRYWKFKELKIDPKKSYLNYNVAFTETG